MNSITINPDIQTLKLLLGEESTPIQIVITDDVIYKYLEEHLHDYIDEEALTQAETTVSAIIDPTLDKYVADMRDFGINARAKEIQQLLRLDVEKAVKDAVHNDINKTTARVVKELKATITDAIKTTVTSQTAMHINQGVSERLYTIQNQLNSPPEPELPYTHILEWSQGA